MERTDVSVRSLSAAFFIVAHGRRRTAVQAGAAANKSQADKQRWHCKALAPFIIETLERVGREVPDTGPAGAEQWG